MCQLELVLLEVLILLRFYVNQLYTPRIASKRYINSINDVLIRSKDELLNTVRKLRENGTTKCIVQLMVDESDAPSMSVDGTPQIYFEHINNIHNHLQEIIDNKPTH